MNSAVSSNDLNVVTVEGTGSLVETVMLENCVWRFWMCGLSEFEDVIFLGGYQIFTDITIDLMLKTFRFDFRALKSSNTISVVSQTTVILVLFNCIEYM